MILDFHPSTGAYTLRIKRGEADPKQIMEEEGFMWSKPLTSNGEAVLFTREPYAAATYSAFAAPEARAQLMSLITEIEASQAKVCNAQIKCPQDKELWPFQRANVVYAKRRRNTLIGDQPGLGKTPVGICFANEIGAKRVLVLCPASIRLQWERMIRQWSTMRWPYVVYPILNSNRGVHPHAEWTIVSFDLARTELIGALLAAKTYDLVIIDEIHYLKEIDSRRTRAVFGDHTGWYREAERNDEGEITGHRKVFEALAGKCGAILGLSGTPLPNRPREAYVAARGLCWDAIDFMSKDSFDERFNPRARLTGRRADGSEYQYTREEVGRAGELQNRLRVNFMARHMRRDVMDQLKLPIYDIVLMDKSEAVKQALAAESMLDIDPDHPELFKKADAAVLGQVAVVRHMMGLAIAPLAAQYCQMLLEGGEDKLCVFGWHIDVMNILQERLSKYGIIRIDGSVLPARRQILVDSFVADKSKRVCLGNFLSIGTGTDGLQTVCNHVVFPEYDWVPGNNEQAVARLDRGGQKRTVLADFCVAPGSLGERILSSSVRKLHTTNKVLDRRIT